MFADPLSGFTHYVTALRKQEMPLFNLIVFGVFVLILSLYMPEFTPGKHFI